MIAYDDRLDVAVFLTDRDRVFVHDGHAMNNWTLTDPKEELRDWLPPAQYELAMDALSRYSLRRRFPSASGQLNSCSAQSAN